MSNHSLLKSLQIRESDLEDKLQSEKAKQSQCTKSINEYTTQINEIQQKLDDVKERQQISSKEVNDLSSELKRVQKEIHKIVHKAPTTAISEHAILRYCERVMGLDIEQIKKQMVPQQVSDQIEYFQGGNFPVPSDDERPAYKLVVKNKTVVTVLSGS